MKKGFGITFLVVLLESLMPRTLRAQNNAISKISRGITKGFLLLCFSLFILNNTHAQTPWNQIGLDIDGETAGDNSGWSVSLSADGFTVAIGAIFNDGNVSNTGHVRVYKYISGTWTQQGADIDGEDANDYSGRSVSLSDDGLTVAIGAVYNDGNGATAGHVRVYKYISGTWTQQGADIDGEAANDQSGHSVSLSADGLTVAIGAPVNGGTGSHAGHVRVYKYISGTWTQQGADIDAEGIGNHSGWSVSLSADGLTVAIGAKSNDGNGNNAGQVRVYKYISGTWTQQGADIDGETAGNNSGWSVSLSADGLTVAIGAPFNSGNGPSAGHVRVYKNISGTWTQQGVDIDGEAGGYQSGYSVSLSDDGLTVAVGAPSNGSFAGHVRVYKNISGTWTQQVADIDGEAVGDYSGRSVSLSDDGLIVAIGAPLNDGNGSFAGHVRVYSFCWLTAITDIISSCGAHTWIDGITYTASNNIATHTLTNNAGCDSLVTLDLTINTVDATVSSSQFTITSNASGATYQWIDCNDNDAPIAGETSQSYTATANGDYAVIVTENNCSDTSACENITGIGVGDIALNNAISIYPNPSQGVFAITINGISGNVSILVTDMLGKTLYDAQVNNEITMIDLKNQASGIYLVQVRTKGAVVNRKIIKH
jgi:hypothetical protein